MSKRSNTVHRLWDPASSKSLFIVSVVSLSWYEPREGSPPLSVMSMLLLEFLFFSSSLGGSVEFWSTTSLLFSPTLSFSSFSSVLFIVTINSASTSASLIFFILQQSFYQWWPDSSLILASNWLFQNNKSAFVQLRFIDQNIDWEEIHTTFKAEAEKVTNMSTMEANSIEVNK